MNKNALLSTLITFSLALPVASLALTKSFDSGKPAPPIAIPKYFSTWTTVPNKLELLQADVVRLEYRNAANKNAILIIRRTRGYEQIHDLNVCWNNRALEKQLVEQIRLKDDIGMLNAEFTQVRFPTSSVMLLSWFQNEKVSAPDRWGWRSAQILNGLTSNQFFDQICIGTNDSGDGNADKQFILDVAAKIRPELGH